MQLVLMLLCLGFGPYLYAEDQPGEVPSFIQEDLKYYPFEVEEDRFVVGELSVGQLHILNTYRDDAKMLFARHLGILSINGTKDDIPLLQLIIDQKILRKDEVQKWQALGILFGDVLAREFNMTWVRYEDKYGLSKALRFRRTDNFMFPVIMFSKRVGYNDKIDVQAIYNKLADDVAAFKAWELKPKLPNGLKPS
ncbi:MAG: DUF3806 domain-containing protein [Pseudomonadales bacterium]|nr:DUF3806 domain-containing protein [Pseudomonadales bacterium]